MTNKRAAHEMENSSESAFAPFVSEKDHELFVIERDLLARIVLKQHCPYKRIDIIDRMKTVLKSIDGILHNPQPSVEDFTQLQRVIAGAAERYFQQLSMGLMIPMSTVCLGVLGRLRAILQRIDVKTANSNHLSDSMGFGDVYDEDEGIQILR